MNVNAPASVTCVCDRRRNLHLNDFCAQVKPQWGLGNLPCCSSLFPTPIGEAGVPWCFCQQAGENPIWLPCNGSFEEKLSWQYVEIKVKCLIATLNFGSWGMTGEPQLDHCVSRLISNYPHENQQWAIGGNTSMFQNSVSISQNSAGERRLGVFGGCFNRT